MSTEASLEDLLNESFATAGTSAPSHDNIAHEELIVTASASTSAHGESVDEPKLALGGMPVAEAALVSDPADLVEARFAAVADLAQTNRAAVATFDTQPYDEARLRVAIAVIKGQRAELDAMYALMVEMNNFFGSSPAEPPASG